MKTRSIAFVVVAAVATAILAGCASSSSGPVPIGPDTYMLAKPGDFFTTSGGTVKADLYREAGAFCLKQNRQLMPVSTSSADAGIAKYASAEIQFRCLVAGDRDLKRPTMEASPDIRIEMKRE
ncbi:hypothetical protein [Variovorax sp. J22R115]|uniref:hypothetical protein n=1 Tax=Variovorax sp. J22R115 TaxID=3053509 RepID=UPI002576C01D|nr:hypothetical protein [Variovorax sp. J22R115]MDM0053924.1 hypothetical protein [Variovorax sp. J22R115]